MVRGFQEHHGGEFVHGTSTALFGLQVDYDPDTTGPRAMLEAVDDAGFEAELITDRRCSIVASSCSWGLSMTHAHFYNRQLNYNAVRTTLDLDLQHIHHQFEAFVFRSDDIPHIPIFRPR